MCLPPPPFNVLGELYDCADPCVWKTGWRDRFGENAQESVRGVDQRCLCCDPPLLSVKLSNPVGV